MFLTFKKSPYASNVWAIFREKRSEIISKVCIGAVFYFESHPLPQMFARKACDHTNENKQDKTENPISEIIPKKIHIKRQSGKIHTPKEFHQIHRIEQFEVKRP